MNYLQFSSLTLWNTEEWKLKQITAMYQYSVQRFSLTVEAATVSLFRSSTVSSYLQNVLEKKNTFFFLTEAEIYFLKRLLFKLFFFRNKKTIYNMVFSLFSVKIYLVYLPVIICYFHCFISPKKSVFSLLRATKGFTNFFFLFK